MSKKNQERKQQWCSPLVSLFFFRRLLQFLDVEFDHFEHRLHHAPRFRGVLATQQFPEDRDIPPDVLNGLKVKLLPQDKEVYVLAKSEGRRQKETAIRRRKLARLLRALRMLRRTRQRPWKRDTLLHKLGAAHQEAGKAWGFVKITLPKARQAVHRDTFQFELLKDKLKDAQQRDGNYLLRGFEADDQAGPLWVRYMQLSEIEGAFKTLKSDLQLRLIRHHVELRIEAHILICFLAYCLSVTLRKRLVAHAPGLTPRAVLETLSGILMLDVHVPLANGRELVMPRYTQPEAEHRLVLQKLGWDLPPQPPPRIRPTQVAITANPPETKSKLYWRPR